MDRDFLKKKIQFILAGIVLALIYTIYFSNIGTYTEESLKILGFFSFIQLIYIFWSWHGLTNSYFDAYIVFICACYAFNLGQPILEIFDAVSPERSIITHYKIDINSYCVATFISIYFIFAFHIGAVLSCKISAKEVLTNTSRKIFQLYAKSIYGVATVFALISFPGYLYNTAVNMIISATTGYEGIYEEGTGTIRIFQIIGEYYAPAMICLYFASEILKRRRFLTITIIFVTILFPPLFIGGRSNAIIILAILSIIYSFFHQIKRTHLIVIGICGYCVLVIFAAIAGNRRASERSLDTFLKTDEEKGNPALFTITEMGGSIQPLIHCIDILHDNDFRYGQSYLYATTTIIPNVGIWEVHPATKYSNLGNWLKDYLNLSFGPGFSIVAEAYYNFGWYGFIMMSILGFIFSKFFSKVNKYDLYINPIKFIMAIVLLWLTIKMVRNSFEFAVRAVIYYYLPMYYFMKIQYKRYLKSYLKILAYE